ncbi:hypothetical protein GA0070216_1014 [Micromonospora matsumotoense]|uniref:Uncharacterized protein n=1 Tax=Micromonospora matsumotoense TaxID=121616 RepID=A0A1C4TVN5_9ACTN|nr:hypothetical protein GA0070216_1014 [Micromonospora matsumotoense]
MSGYESQCIARYASTYIAAIGIGKCAQAAGSRGGGPRSKLTIYAM